MTPWGRGVIFKMHAFYPSFRLPFASNRFLSRFYFDRPLLAHSLTVFALALLVQNSAEGYQKTQRTIKLTGKSSHEPGSATRQRDATYAVVPQRYPRPSRSSKKTRSPARHQLHTRAFADSTTRTSDMAAALVTSLDDFLSRLETHVKTGMSNQFLKLVGDMTSDACTEALP